MPKSLSHIPPETTRNPDDELVANPRFMVYLLKTIDQKMDDQKVVNAQDRAKQDERFEKIDKKLEEIPGQYVTKQEHREAVKSLKEDFDGEQKRLMEKVDGIQATLSRINWIIISAVVLALLGLVLNQGNLPG